MNSRVEKNKKQRIDLAIEEQKEKTWEASKKVFKYGLIVIIFISIIYCLFRYVGNYGIQVREYVIDNKNIPNSFYGFKIIQISDLNYGSEVVDIKKVREMVRLVNKINPDIITFTGDLTYGDLSNQELNKLSYELSKMDASIGKYSVYGEDNDSNKILLKNIGFKDLSNSYDLIYNKDQKPILITGLDNNMDIDNSFDYFSSENADVDIFTITLVHKPDNVDSIRSYHESDLILSGHTLNGLIRIPNTGGLIKGNETSRYEDPYYDLGKTKLYISGGVGTREIPFRLFNHPSINLFRLK